MRKVTGSVVHAVNVWDLATAPTPKLPRQRNVIVADLAHESNRQALVAALEQLNIVRQPRQDLHRAGPETTRHLTRLLANEEREQIVAKDVAP